MRERDIVIGLDIGTTSTKAVVFDSGGNIRGAKSVGYPLHRPQPLWAEQDPDDILEAACRAIREAMERSGTAPESVAAVGISSAMHSLLAVDGSGRPLTPIITWADLRSGEISRRLRQTDTGRGIYRRTGTPVHPMAPLSKLIWMRKEAADPFAQAERWISIKEYLISRWFSQYVVDTSIASATGLLNLETLDWDKEALELAGIRREQLSRIVPSTFVLEGMVPRWAERMGLSPDTPWVVGAGDGVLANLGVGAVRPGEAAITIGTSGAFRTVTNRPVTDPHSRTFCYALAEGFWVAGGATNNGGILLRWLNEGFFHDEEEVADPVLKEASLEQTARLAESVPPGAEGLLFHPFLSGERAPWWNPDARGMFFGIGMHHRKEHFVRAVLEGVCFSIFSIGKALEELTGPASDIRISGGFVRFPLWPRILCDILGRELQVPETEEASAAGAAYLALFAVGKVRSLDGIRNWTRIRQHLKPDLSQQKIYRERYEVYERLYRKLEDEYREIAQFHSK
ncbi:gluconate kinase (FGGY family) [Melghirimyces profundicolus]|uniref:Gluconate kinase (FGGY family) n=1 Tax=Melghirimyces profundicolus TaxID=1242148 RepID=A0A2T6BUB0_9BACL|nr:gluconokinase [Melghirimyces profundicolus]PTX59652.1 gluconate kinase (FGGY family) [Melghirimyces profundicolus]